jgi:small ligand-binding sensory domain FIST
VGVAHHGHRLRAMRLGTRTTRAAVGRSTIPLGAEAAREAGRQAAAGLSRSGCDLAFLFLTPDHADVAAEAAMAVRDELDGARLVGCVAEGIVAGERELEHGPAAAVWAAALPGAAVETFHAAALDLDGSYVVAGFPEADDADLVVLLADPFTFPVAPFLARLNEDRPGLPLVGGVAGGGGRPGTQALIVDDDIYSEGAVGITLSGVPAVTVVSQGCAAIGRESVVTSADANVVYELAGQPALARLRKELASLDEERQRLAAEGILAGLVIDENKPEYGPGDYLIRGLIGIDDQSEAIAIGELVRPGQTLRFHVRDADSADADLRRALAAALEGHGRPVGALLFTCNGRGTSMFAAPDHDARAVTSALGASSVAGFFCGGEIGPVGGRAFLHGFTATLAVLFE